MKVKLKVYFQALILILSISSSAWSSNLSKNEIMLQGFNWESYRQHGGWYNLLLEKVPDMAQTGFTMIWMPPPNHSYDGEGMYPHSRGYIPLEYYNLNTPYGSHSELVFLIKKLNLVGIKAIADTVINHRGKHGGTSENPIIKNPEWGLWAFTGGSGLVGQGNPDTGAKTDFAYDLDHTNPYIMDYLTGWMKWLLDDIGFSGFRFDFAKGFSGKFIGHFLQKLNPYFTVGEYWVDMDWSCYPTICYNQDVHRQSVANWIDSTWKGQVRSEEASTSYDFTTKGILQTAVKRHEFWRLKDSRGKAPGLIGYWPVKSITFIDNHDTGSTQNHWPFGNMEEVMQGYAYILTHPGVPCVFWDHFYDWGLKDKIKNLIKLRKNQNIQSDADLSIVKAESGLYAAYIDGKIAVKLGPNLWTPENSGGWKMYDFGINWAVWVKK
ncbi:MAG: hypothetical protein KAQ98_08735 [Bacteriovoracaceae bacterium]|nr:hypothetical protein [Bacteriovoracaceae bacterium]